MQIPRKVLEWDGVMWVCSVLLGGSCSGNRFIWCTWARGARFEYLVIDPKGGRYGQTQIKPRTVIVRRKGQHLSIEGDDGGLVSDQLRWKRIDEDALTSRETRQRSEEECLAAFDRVYQRYRSK